MRFHLFLLICLTLLSEHIIADLQNNDAFTKQPQISANIINQEAPASFESDEFLPVEQAYALNLDFEQNNNKSFDSLRVNWQIVNGYYLYRHGFTFDIHPTQENDQQTSLNVNIPSGKKKKDDYFGEVEVYYHNVDVILTGLPKNTVTTLAVTSQGCADAGLCYPPQTQYFAIDTINGTITSTNAPNTIKKPEQLGPEEPVSTSLFYMLVLAVLGGAILNLMPCVFPVLSLKILSFANDKDHNKVLLGSIYSLGVVVSFVAVASVLLFLQSAGKAVGWGFHLQSPWFVAALTYLFFVMGLSLSGFIEFGSQWMNTGNSLANKPGYSGSFFTGVLATVVASPCTAPFMGTALGFAVTQSAGIALSIFAALGFGMSLPVLLLSCSPKLLNKIPKPGLWMVHLKEFLAFPLYATAVWLIWVVGKQAGVNAMGAVLLGCVLLTLSLWLWSKSLIRRMLSALAALLALAILASSLLLPSTNNNQTDANSQWLHYDAELLQQLRDQGKPVFINVTADWCITCLANEKVTLSTDRVKQAFANAGITYLKADWTNYDPAITALLSQYRRTGIPLYLFYPSDSSKDVVLLPQILTSDTVISVITQSTQ